MQDWVLWHLGPSPLKRLQSPLPEIAIFFRGHQRLVTATNYRKMIPTRKKGIVILVVYLPIVSGVLGATLINVMIDNVFPYDNYNN